jgi:hypothetical protein
MFGNYQLKPMNHPEFLILFEQKVALRVFLGNPETELEVFREWVHCSPASLAEINQ